MGGIVDSQGMWLFHFDQYCRLPFLEVVIIYTPYIFLDLISSYFKILPSEMYKQWMIFSPFLLQHSLLSNFLILSSLLGKKYYLSVVNRQWFYCEGWSFLQPFIFPLNSVSFVLFFFFLLSHRGLSYWFVGVFMY